MSGFIGFSNTIDRTDQHSTILDGAINAMTDAIAHRGPDGTDAYYDEDIAVGFRWMGTIDTTACPYPMTNEDESLIMVCDGEIYNHHELRDELIEAGHTFVTDADTEVILHGYEEWSVDELLARLRGKFSFVIWDKRQKSLFGARDRFGIKPFYYFRRDVDARTPFIFGSEIKGLIHHPQFKKKLNQNVLANYLSFQYSATQETFFKDVYKLPPAHYFVWYAPDAPEEDTTGSPSGIFRMTRYWRPHFMPTQGPIEVYADQIDHEVAETVALHTQVASDVKLGSFLSSGVDSSYIAKVAGVDETYTVGFESELYNETDYAKKFADSIGVTNHAKVITSQEYWDVLGTVQYHMDEPLADPAAVGLYFASQLASQHARVVLSGEGADELFAGYKIYREPVQLKSWQKSYRGLPPVVRSLIKFVARPLYLLMPKLPGRDFLMTRDLPLQQWYIGNANIFSVAERNRILRVDKQAPTPQQIAAPFYAQAAQYDEVTQMQYLDINLWSAGDILLKADRMTSANSIEVRSPLLDRQVMELAQVLPLDAKLDAVHTKKAFREAAAKYVPELTANKDKLGFPVPLRVWLKEDCYYERVRAAFTSDVAKKYFHSARLVTLLDDLRSSHDDKTSNELSRKIWTVYMFLVWYDEFFVKR